MIYDLVRLNSKSNPLNSTDEGPIPGRFLGAAAPLEQQVAAQRVPQVRRDLLDAQPVELLRRVVLLLAIAPALVQARVVVGGPDHNGVVGGHRLFLFTLLNLLGGYSDS